MQSLTASKKTSPVDLAPPACSIHQSTFRLFALINFVVKASAGKLIEMEAHVAYCTRCSETVSGNLRAVAAPFEYSLTDGAKELAASYQRRVTISDGDTVIRQYSNGSYVFPLAGRSRSLQPGPNARAGGHFKGCPPGKWTLLKVGQCRFSIGIWS